MVFYENNEKGKGDEVLYCEIKRWVEDGTSEIPGIQSDVEWLNRKNNPGMMMIISNNPIGKIKDNIDWIEKQVPLLKGHLVDKYCFLTVGSTGKPLEFFILGYLFKNIGYHCCPIIT